MSRPRTQATTGPMALLADVLWVVKAAKMDGQSIPFEDALEGKTLAAWKRIEADIRRTLAEQPS